MGRNIQPLVTIQQVKACLVADTKISFAQLVAKVAKKVKKTAAEVADDVWRVLLSMRQFAKQITFNLPIRNIVEELSPDEHGRKGKSKRVLMKSSQEARNNTIITCLAAA